MESIAQCHNFLSERSPHTMSWFLLWESQVNDFYLDGESHRASLQGRTKTLSRETVGTRKRPGTRMQVSTLSRVFLLITCFRTENGVQVDLTGCSWFPLLKIISDAFSRIILGNLSPTPISHHCFTCFGGNQHPSRITYSYSLIREQLLFILL